MVGALMVTAFFAATEIAKAADVSFSGQIRTRFEVNEQADFSDATEADDFTSTRVRLNANVNVNDSTSAFIQMQSVRTWGESLSTGGVGSGNASYTNSDADASVGLHQAYFTLKNFASLPVDLQLGRQEVVLDGHRLFGHTGWAQGANTHDAVRLTHSHDNMTLMYAWIQANESASRGDNRNDVEAHLLYGNLSGVLGGKLSVTYAWLMDNCGATANTITAATATRIATNTETCNNLQNDIHTIGVRQAGQLFGIDYRGEYYYQWGDANADKVGTLGTAGGDVDRDASMFGVRIGKAFDNVTMKPSLTVWYDYLSGTSDEEARNNEYGSFNTLFDTGHKFYGLMDVFGAVGSGGADAATDGLGLQDVAVKAKLSPMPGWTLKADYHWFFTAEGLAGSPTIGRIGNQDNDIGSELDITLINKYNANTNIVIGYSNYTASEGLNQVNTAGGRGVPDDANWAYVMFDVKF